MKTVYSAIPIAPGTILAVILLSLSGCSESSGSTDSYNTSVKGSVFLMDEHERPLSDHSGVAVTLRSEKTYLTFSKTDGSWEYSGALPGSYTISFTKNGFTSTKLFHVDLVEKQPALAVESFLYEPPKYSIIFDAITMPTDVDHSGGVYMHSLDNTPGNLYSAALVIAGHSQSLSIEDTSSYILCATAGIASISTTDTAQDIQGKIYYQTLQLYFSKGETIYFRAYPFPAKGMYYDQTTSKDVITGYGKGSNILSAVMQ